MAPSGRSIASAALIGVSLLLFVPAFADASAGVSYGSWSYGAQLDVVLTNLPLLLAVAGVALLLAPVARS